MTDLTADLFAPFFQAVHGYPPHRWQDRLARQVLDTGRWPSLLDLPTGVGKTSALDIAVFALAANPSQFPRRIAFVVDRRLIVDQVGHQAAKLAAALAEPSDSVVAQVASQLRDLSGVGRWQWAPTSPISWECRSANSCICAKSCSTKCALGEPSRETCCDIIHSTLCAQSISRRLTGNAG